MLAPAFLSIGDRKGFTGWFKASPTEKAAGGRRQIIIKKPRHQIKTFTPYASQIEPAATISRASSQASKR